MSLPPQQVMSVEETTEDTIAKLKVHGINVTGDFSSASTPIVDPPPPPKPPSPKPPSPLQGETTAPPNPAPTALPTPTPTPPKPASKPSPLQRAGALIASSTKAFRRASGKAANRASDSLRKPTPADGEEAAPSEVAPSEVTPSLLQRALSFEFFPPPPPLLYTVTYWFRGTWCPACRAQVAELNSLGPSLRQAGIEVVCATAEPGGDDAVKERLKLRGAPTGAKFKKWKVAVRSDPYHELFREDVEYTTERFSWKESGQCKFHPTPELVVVDANTGKLLKSSCWSWAKIQLKAGAAPDDAAIISSPSFVGVQEEGAPETMMRPKMKDLQAAIEERRQVKIGPAYAIECK